MPFLFKAEAFLKKALKAIETCLKVRTYIAKEDPVQSKSWI